ncbi:hypothetical protein KKI23_00160 [Patescibacteria group bacterium]|nr:hypothetical protein [Patescibacteria group bacterium]
MEKRLAPATALGKWSVGLNILFLGEIVATIVIFRGIMGSSFDNHWWDWTIATAFPIGIIALILGAIAYWRKQDRSTLVLSSVILGILLVVFILTHSLYIND